MLLLLFSNLSFSSERKQDDLVIQSTTSTRDSGFYKFILPEFEKLYKIKVKVVAYGTGQAIVNAKNCNADILIVHSIDDEIDFINQNSELMLNYAECDDFRRFKEHLLKFCKRLNIDFRGENNWAAIHYTVLNGNNLSTRFLIKKRANIDAETANLLTPLMIACQK